MSTLGVCLLVLLAGVALFAPRGGLIRAWQRVRAYRRRTKAEDALKHILAWKHRSQLATLESLAGALRLSPAAVLQLATHMESAGWIATGAEGLALTPRGERRALEVVRAHRLWERHLSDDANMPIARLHQVAERAEHSLTSRQLAELDAHLGHPQHDPHGDPIPAADGEVEVLEAVSLHDWPVGASARIVHIEDEPDVVFRQLLAAGLQPSLVVRLVASEPNSLVIETDAGRRRIGRALAANIQVAAVREQDILPPDAVRLSELGQGAAGEVLELGTECRGFSRRRLLDLGLTPGAQVQLALDNTFGDPRAFLIRGTTIALRSQQTDHVWIRPLPRSVTRKTRP